MGSGGADRYEAAAARAHQPRLSVATHQAAGGGRVARPRPAARARRCAAC